MLEFKNYDESKNSIEIQCTLKDIDDIDVALEYAEKYIKKIGGEKCLLDFIFQKQNEIQEIKNKTRF